MNIISKLRRKFTSGNSVPVERASIKATEFAELESELKRQGQLSKNMADAIDDLSIAIKAMSNWGAEPDAAWEHLDLVIEARQAAERAAHYYRKNQAPAGE